MGKAARHMRKLAHHRVPIDLLLHPRSKVEERRHQVLYEICRRRNFSGRSKRL